MTSEKFGAVTCQLTRKAFLHLRYGALLLTKDTFMWLARASQKTMLWSLKRIHKLEALEREYWIEGAVEPEEHEAHS